MPEKVLIYTHDRAILPSLISGLEKRGFLVSHTGNKKQVLSMVSHSSLDYVVVDSAGDKERGIDFCAKLREADPFTRIICVLPDQSTHSFDFIDEMIQAPLTFRKLHLRIQRLGQGSPRYLVPLGPFIFDPRHRLLRRGDEEISLTPKEKDLLWFFIQHAGENLSRKRIMREIWNTNYSGDTRTLEVHVCWLRKKVEPEPCRPQYILTLRGFGYRFIPPTPESPEDDSPS